MRITQVIHPSSARSENRANVPRRQKTVPAAMSRPRPARYVFVPHGLISAFAHDALAVGIYVAIARLAMAAKGVVPLAARDLVAWMGSDQDSDRVAIMRRIIKLEQRGWLSITRTATGKHQLLPTWGRDQSGMPRPWRFDQDDCGRPQHIRGRRVPIALLDDFLGRLEPQAGKGRALISRYFTRPLLDMTDIGVYAIGLHVETTPTPRLRHLGLWNSAGMAALPDTEVLLARAAAGNLTTGVEDRPIHVGLSLHGYARLGVAIPKVDIYADPAESQSDGSPDGSAAGSRRLREEVGYWADQDQQIHEAIAPTALIAWDVGISHELTNRDSAGPSFEGDAAAAVFADGHFTQGPLEDPRRSTEPEQRNSVAACEMICGSLDHAVVQGHQLLNAHRSILAGEWIELLAIQAAHGVGDLLILQARARRASVLRPQGITPAYYLACAARALHVSDRSGTRTGTATKIWHALPKGERPTTAEIDSECAALLRSIGVREWHTLGSVPRSVITAWADVITHPGLIARFDSPVGFAVKQMRQGQGPPSQAELDRWAQSAARKADRYDSWRHHSPLVCSEQQIADEKALEARVRAIAPPGADVVVLCLLADWLEHGASESEVAARLMELETRGDQ